MSDTVICDSHGEAEVTFVCSHLAEDYPDTLNLKMQAYIQELGTRPIFALEETDHPLAQEFHHGVAPERVREIMERWVDLPIF